MKKVHFTVYTLLSKIMSHKFVNIVLYTSQCMLKMGHVLPTVH